MCCLQRPFFFLYIFYCYFRALQISLHFSDSCSGYLSYVFLKFLTTPLLFKPSSVSPILRFLSFFVLSYQPQQFVSSFHHSFSNHCSDYFSPQSLFTATYSHRCAHRIIMPRKDLERNLTRKQNRLCWSDAGCNQASIITTPLFILIPIFFSALFSSSKMSSSLVFPAFHSIPKYSRSLVES